ncbi:MAG: TatD family hydrolase [Zoogloeaceae bacterium]|jgi:TatD DNase family protein|nr:TatD family hydrolase [Zoogloeaceae bacterium]
MLIDSHCHLDFPELFAELPRVLTAMQEADVAGALCIGVNLEDFPKVLALAENHARLFASVALHPEYDDKAEEPDVARLVALSTHGKVIAIGETGLDYHWHKEKPEWQRERFRTHIRAALAAQKPLVIHSRNAAEDTLRILEEEDAARCGGIFHCFSEDWVVAERALALGFYLSFSGIVTFKNAKAVQEVAVRAPLARILVETDAPYLAPHPFRGKRNEPAYVRHTAECVARLRGMPFAALAHATTENFFSLFPQTREAFSSCVA